MNFSGSEEKSPGYKLLMNYQIGSNNNEKVCFINFLNNSPPNN